MASPATLFVAGMTSVIVALGLGFGGALLLTSTKPPHKEAPAAFSKRDEPLQAQTPASAPLPASVTPGVEPGAKSASEPDLTVGLAPSPGTPPIPKPDDVIKALSNNPPPAVVEPAPAVRPAPVKRAPEESSAAKVELPNKKAKEARETSSDARDPKTRSYVANKPKPERVERSTAVPDDGPDEADTSAIETHAEPDRATRRGF